MPFCTRYQPCPGEAGAGVLFLEIQKDLPRDRRHNQSIQGKWVREGSRHNDSGSFQQPRGVFPEDRDTKSSCSSRHGKAGRRMQDQKILTTEYTEEKSDQLCHLVPIPVNDGKSATWRSLFDRLRSQLVRYLNHLFISAPQS